MYFTYINTWGDQKKGFVKPKFVKTEVAIPNVFWKYAKNTKFFTVIKIVSAIIRKIVQMGRNNVSYIGKST